MHLQQMKLALAITLAFASFIGNSAPVRAQPSVQVSADQQKAPDKKDLNKEDPKTGTPNGNPHGGGTRPGEISSCQETKESLTALTPANGKGLTVSQHPTFWFYVPYDLKYIRSVKFSLRDYDQDERTIYRTTLKLSGTPGVIAISLPKDPKYSLEVNKRYHWYLIIDCQPKKQSNKPDIVLDGYTTVVDLTPARKSQLEAVKPQECIPYKENCIWYDFLNNLANRHFANPQDTAVNNAWVDLLKSVGLEGIAQKPKAVSEPSPEK